MKIAVPDRRSPFRAIDDYGMLLVLLLLAAFFSVCTFNEQHPSGADAGIQVADFIANGHFTNVLIVVRDTVEDGEFADAVEMRLAERDIDVLSTVRGGPGDVRVAIDKILSEGGRIDAVAANDVSAKWTIFDRYVDVGREKCVTPQPYRWPDFLKRSNLLGVANQTAIYAIIAVGMTMVIMTAGIDLSVGSLVALSSVTAAVLIRKAGGVECGLPAMIAACFAGIVVCSLSGLFTGLMVTRFGVPPFIVSLSVMMMASGIAFRISEGRSVPEVSQSFLWIGGSNIMGVPSPVWMMGIIYLVAHWVMSRTVFGRYVYAIGGNPEASRLSGVPVGPVLLAVYVLSGALAGAGGIILSSKLAAGDPKFGDMYELDVIAAVVVGGTSLMGGEGRIFGTLIGAFIIATIKNGMNLTDVDPFNQKIALGAVLLGAVLVDRLKRRP
ncbi:MAG: ABC transporter permease [Planctomycetaceae bacterium]|nr:ABC transporter permease [Planctomycetaceae bacterium]